MGTLTEAAADPTRQEWARLQREFHALRTRDPNACVSLGLAERLGELPDPSRAAEEAQLDDVRKLLSRLGALPAEQLDPDSELDVRLMRLSLQAQEEELARELDGVPEASRLPRAGAELGEGLFLQFVNDPRPAGERLATITSRIEGIPAYLDTLLGRLEQPLARWVAIERQQVAELPQLFSTLAAWSDEVGFAGGAGLRAAIVRAEAALARYSRRLAALPTSHQLHLGEAAARRIVALLGIDKSLEQLHGMARDFLAATAETIEGLRARLVQKHELPKDTSTEDLSRYLARTFRVALPDGRLEGVIERYQREHERLLAFITERELFPVPEDQELVILRTPRFMEPSVPAGAMMPPPPFRRGPRTSLVYLTLSQELLDEHTELSIPGMMIHEGVPGHHLQLATAAGHASLVRRHFVGLHHAEGWTTMLEDYMLDQGYMGELTDEARFVGKRDIARLGARVGIDLYFMTGHRDFLSLGADCDVAASDPFVAAGNLLEAVTGFVPARVEAELNWYSQERGYPLSYLAGNRMLWELKHDVARHSPVGGLELDRRFHALYLGSGSMPIPMLREVFQRAGLLG